VSSLGPISTALETELQLRGSGHWCAGLRCRCTELGNGLLQWDALLEVPVELHDAITDGFQLVRLPRIGQQELPAMATSGTGRDVEASPSPEIRDRPAAPAPPLA
jgi:hypothetical protein